MRPAHISKRSPRGTRACRRSLRRSTAALADAADGDGRRARGILETAAAIAAGGGEPARISLDAVREAVGRRTLLHDRDREEHYNVASAFIKSLRGSDPDAALYYAAR